MARMNSPELAAFVFVAPEGGRPDARGPGGRPRVANGRRAEVNPTCHAPVSNGWPGAH